MNNFIEISHLGTVTRVKNGDEMLKAMGYEEPVHQTIILHDEDGQLIGCGRGVEGLYKSMPVIQAIKETPLHKPRTRLYPKEKPLAKSYSEDCPFFGGVYADIWNRLDSVGK